METPTKTNNKRSRGAGPAAEFDLNAALVAKGVSSALDASLRPVLKLLADLVATLAKNVTQPTASKPQKGTAGTGEKKKLSAGLCGKALVEALATHGQVQPNMATAGQSPSFKRAVYNSENAGAGAVEGELSEEQLDSVTDDMLDHYSEFASRHWGQNIGRRMYAQMAEKLAEERLLVL